jgi:iron complex transport system permease protein
MKDKMNEILHNRLLWLLILVLFSIYSLTIGVKDFSLIGAIKGNGDDVGLILISRLPRLISILVTGASLSIAGLIMQTMTQNKFVSPSTAGTMEWCRFGIMIAMFFFGGQSTMLKMGTAFIAALFGTLLFMQVLQRIRFKNNMIVPLVGMMLGNVVSSITSYIAYKFDMIQNMSSWLQGNFSLIIKGRYELLYIGIPFLIIAYLYANKFTIAGMGEDFTKSLGVNHKKIVMIGLVIVAVITSTIVVTVGSIPFIGLIIPNIVAIIKGDNLKNTIPDTAILGAFFVLVCDILGRVIMFPYEVPISVIISVLGSVLFLILLFWRKRHAG